MPDATNLPNYLRMCIIHLNV